MAKSEFRPVVRLKNPIPGCPLAHVESLAIQSGMPLMKAVIVFPMTLATMTSPLTKLRPMEHGPRPRSTVKSPNGPFHRTISRPPGN